MKAILSLLLLTPGLLFAELSVPHFFSDHMILQRERAAAIWGKADAGAEVTVSFKGRSAAAKAAADGQWRAQIETGAADAQGAASLGGCVGAAARAVIVDHRRSWHVGLLEYVCSPNPGPSRRRGRSARESVRPEVDSGTWNRARY